MHEIIEISDRLFPVGSTAWHDKHQFCYIVEANHFRRTVLYEREPEDYHLAEVSVHDLVSVPGQQKSQK